MAEVCKLGSESAWASGCFAASISNGLRAALGRIDSLASGSPRASNLQRRLSGRTKAIVRARGCRRSGQVWICAMGALFQPLCHPAIRPLFGSRVGEPAGARPLGSMSPQLGRRSSTAALMPCIPVPNLECTDDDTVQHAARPRTPHPPLAAGARAGARLHPAADDGPEHRCDDQLRRRAGQGCPAHHRVGHRRLRGVSRLCTLHRAACRLRTGLAGHGPRTRHRPAHRRRAVHRLRADPDGSRHLPHRRLESVELSWSRRSPWRSARASSRSCCSAACCSARSRRGSAAGLRWWCLRSCSA